MVNRKNIKKLIVVFLILIAMPLALAEIFIECPTNVLPGAAFSCDLKTDTAIPNVAGVELYFETGSDSSSANHLFNLISVNKLRLSSMFVNLNNGIGIYGESFGTDFVADETLLTFNLQAKSSVGGGSFDTVSFSANTRECDLTTGVCFVLKDTNTNVLLESLTILSNRITVGTATTLATCSDGIQNQDETGVDCGGNTCSACVQTCPPVAATACSTGTASDCSTIAVLGCPSGESCNTQGLCETTTGTCPSGEDLIELNDGTTRCDPILERVRNAIKEETSDLSFVSRVAGAFRGLFERIGNLFR